MTRGEERRGGERKKNKFDSKPPPTPIEQQQYHRPTPIEQQQYHRLTSVIETVGQSEIEKAVSLLWPLIVFGKGAAIARAENGLKKLVETTGIPFLPTPMGKGLLPDTHELAATVARSLAIGKCDVAVVVGARLNWLLHFGEPPKWSKDVKFISVDISKEEIEL